MFDLIAFDADDTLWQNEELYLTARQRVKELLARYGADGLDFDEHFDEVEVSNLPYYGYGIMGFVFSLVETAIQLTGGDIAGKDVQALIDLAKEMLSAEVRLFDGAEETLARLARSYPLMLITKGDLHHQQSKIVRSGLREYFRDVEVVSDKTPETYRTILTKHGIAPSRFLMVGNSLRSDILPVIEMGGWAVYIPNELTWSHEMVDPRERLSDRLFELEALTLLPDLIEDLTGSRPDEPGSTDE